MLSLAEKMFDSSCEASGTAESSEATDSDFLPNSKEEAETGVETGSETGAKGWTLEALSLTQAESPEIVASKFFWTVASVGSECRGTMIGVKFDLIGKLLRGTFVGAGDGGGRAVGTPKLEDSTSPSWDWFWFAARICSLGGEGGELCKVLNSRMTWSKLKLLTVTTTKLSSCRDGKMWVWIGKRSIEQREQFRGESSRKTTGVFLKAPQILNKL